MVAPYSLFVSFGLAMALAPPIYASHYISYAIIRNFYNTLTASNARAILPTQNKSALRGGNIFFFFIGAFATKSRGSHEYSGMTCL